jgi:hypothetical protein
MIGAPVTERRKACSFRTSAALLFLPNADLPLL